MPFVKVVKSSASRFQVKYRCFREPLPAPINVHSTITKPLAGLLLTNKPNPTTFLQPYPMADPTAPNPSAGSSTKKEDSPK
ncbi:hypothetical protein PtB15_5B303 [Puccinia triticina]|nr:hypothetical protein PtB15_5B303 [Puccinia triticina]